MSNNAVLNPSPKASATAAAAPSHAELLERARRISRKAEARAEQTDRERCIPRETIAELYDADLMRLVQPPQWGGLGRSFHELYELVYELARGCGSTGWIYCVLAGHSVVVGTFPAEAQAAVWGDDRKALVSSAFAPTLQARKVDGGYEISGKSPFSSGTDHASWALLGGVVLDEKGAPARKLFLVPRSDYAIHDDWFVMGLAGTGSKTLEVAGAFVPEVRVVDLQDFFSGLAPHSLQSAMVGAARGGIDSFVESIRNSPGKFGGRPPAELELFQTVVGSAVGDVTYAWELLQKITCECEPIVLSGQAMPPEQILRNRSATSTISRLCLGALERVFELSGGQGIYNNRLSRALRDVRAAANHAALNATLAGKDAGLLALKRG
ncbi:MULTISPECIES: acyl-CoA dehydrogenase family protein [Comamonadaceae]|jgi:alkylation response protein AidB-like acyl-CoA dehydrogenase|uniref:Acyl-CoA dehydrogenase C-terminal domain-containing protein n=3 Tax=cellular organisms TaxID=131567 RepID=A0A420RY41_GIBIN|nr:MULTISPECIES: acyl-CoA dehydrogenase family protein [Comamonadaceae]RKL21927.1 hypothetical protein BFJ72_g14798 [Fusarium proliferatum]GAO20700.1 acyl-CoA dehydrogenase type 2 domain [Alicycliphilus sp. B1]MDR7093003.1 3-hydroxy-9,10-secoandrosta-1,3,5(10)-triene-9,17-dione monooxygenase [Hydrogenophaga laconesensis]NCU65441.1 hypothetical protein [Acidovorax sp. 210-6]POR09020.1 hypothetical protein BV908_17560 [Diaphorobacter sp. LR2014-1]